MMIVHPLSGVYMYLSDAREKSETITQFSSPVGGYICIYVVSLYIFTRMGSFHPLSGIYMYLSCKRNGRCRQFSSPYGGS